MGVVYEGWDRERRARVALKTLPTLDPHKIYLFKNEFRSLAGVSHPNLTALYELFSEDGYYFFSMEYVEGVNFLEFVRARSASADTITGADAETVEQKPASPAADTAGGARPTGAAFDDRRLRDSLGPLAHAVRALHPPPILHRH